MVWGEVCDFYYQINQNSTGLCTILEWQRPLLLSDRDRRYGSDILASQEGCYVPF